MDTHEDFKALQGSIQNALVSTVKTVNRLGTQDLAFLKSASPDFRDRLEGTVSRMLDLSNQLLESCAKACDTTAPTVEDADDVDLNWKRIVDLIDTSFEKADLAIDEFRGLRKRNDTPEAPVC